MKELMPHCVAELADIQIPVQVCHGFQSRDFLLKLGQIEERNGKEADANLRPLGLLMERTSHLTDTGIVREFESSYHCPGWLVGLMSCIVEAWEWAVQLSQCLSGKLDLKYFDHRPSVIACGTPGF